MRPSTARGRHALRQISDPIAEARIDLARQANPGITAKVPTGAAVWLSPRLIPLELDTRS
jgi:hypothetical protein